MALRRVSRQINKMKSPLADFSNFEFVPFEMEGLNNALVELQVAQDNFLEVLDNDSDSSSGMKFTMEMHVFKFKQSV